MSRLNPKGWPKVLIALGILSLGIGGGIVVATLMDVTVLNGIRTGLMLAIGLSAALQIVDWFGSPAKQSTTTTSPRTEDVSSNDAGSTDEALKMILDWRANDDEPTKEDLRELGHQGPLSVYASQRVRSQFENLPKSNREALTKKIESLRRGGVDDVAKGRMHDLTEFRDVLREFDLKFDIIETQPRDTDELPSIANDEASTEVGLLFTAIYERTDRTPASF